MQQGREILKKEFLNICDINHIPRQSLFISHNEYKTAFKAKTTL